MSRLERLIEEHCRWREEGVNLIASENRMSDKARKALASDLEARYHSPWYGGSSVIDSVVQETEGAARALFGCDHAVVTALSGNLCDLAVILALTAVGDQVAMAPIETGGYPLDVSLLGRERVDLPMKPNSYEVDSSRLDEVEGAALVICGSSFIPFPHPVEDLAKLPGRLVYDGSHVLGLIGTGVFQNPLAEGAEVLIGSTHKSLYGPQGGLVLTNDSGLYEKLSAVLDFGVEGLIGLVDNPHPGRVAALGLTLEELAQDGEYGRRVVANAQALARALSDRGVGVRFADQGFTESHQLFLDVDLDRGKELCAVLEKEGVFVDIAGRCGTAEVTRRGMTVEDMASVADRIATGWTRVCGG